MAKRFLHLLLLMVYSCNNVAWANTSLEKTNGTIQSPSELSDQDFIPSSLKLDPPAQLTEDFLKEEALELSEKDLPEELKALKDAAVEINGITDESTAKATKELISFDFNGAISYNKFINYRKIQLHSLLLGQRHTLDDIFKEILPKLVLPGDPQFKFYVSLNKYPGAVVDFGNKHIILNIGTIGYAKNKDELAGILSVALERGRDRVLNAGQYHKSNFDHINSIAESKDLPPSQLEFLKADLRAVERLIHAKYNPFALYDVYKRISSLESTPLEYRFFKWVYRNWNGGSRDFYAEAPIFSIRMSAVKAYLAWKQEQEDLYDIVRTTQSFNGKQKLLAFKLYLYQLTTTNRTAMRTKAMMMRLLGLWTTYISAKATANYVLHQAKDVEETATKVTEVQDTKSALDMYFEFSGETSAVITETLQKIEEYLKSQGLETTGETVRELTDIYIAISTKWDVIARYVTGDGASGLVFISTVSIIPILFSYAIYKLKLYEVDSYGKENPILRAKFNTMKSNTKKLTKMLKFLNMKNDKNDEILFRMISIFNSSTKTAEEILLHENVYREYRVVSGLSLVRLRQSWLAISMLRDAEQRLSHIQNDFDKKIFFKKLSAVLNQLPRYMSESFLTRTQLLRISRASKSFRNYNIDALSADFPEKESTEAEEWEKILRLRTYPRSQLTTAQKIQTMFKLENHRMLNSAERIFTVYKIPIIDYIFSAKNQDKTMPLSIVKTLHKIRNTPRIKMQSGVITAIKPISNMAELISSHLKDRGSFEKSAGSYSLSMQTPVGFPKYLKPRYWFNRLKHKEVISYLTANHQSLSQMIDHLNKEFVPRNVIMESYTYDILHVLFRNPYLIKNSHDIDQLLATEYLWPKLGKSAEDFSGIEEMLMLSVLEMKEKYPEAWKYEPSSAEKLHAFIISKIKEFGLWEENVKWKYNLWKRLTQRGVTSTTDSLFIEIYELADAQLRKEMETSATKKGLVWEVSIKGQLAQDHIKKSNVYNELLNETNEAKRLDLIKKTASLLKELLPERGYYFEEILEDLSVKINSSASESKLIHELKIQELESTTKEKDIGIRVMSDILGDVLNWTKKNQFDFLLFLIDKKPANPKIQKTFSNIGPERIKKMFQLMPIASKTAFLDTLLDSSSGLMPSGSVTKGYGKSIVDFLLEGRDQDMQKVSRQILEAFFDSLASVGNKSLGTYILSYILSLPSSEIKTAGHVLKNCLEIMGLTGVKIAQFLAASEMLSAEDTEILRSSQEKANPPKRNEIYSDLNDIFGKTKIPFKVMNNLGSASIKYTFRAIDTATHKEIAVKIFRKSAFTKARQQFRILEGMADYMIENFGKDYTIVKTIVNASIQAVTKELSAQDEVVKSDRARIKVYPRVLTPEKSMSIPRDVYVHKRMIVAEFARGSSLYSPEIPSQFREAIAEEILKMEAKILFADKNLVLFEPDRHAGNYRVRVIQEESGPSIEIRVIDLGQLTEITRAERQDVYDLFALAQILKTIGVTESSLSILKKKYTNLDTKKVSGLLSHYFGKNNLSELNAYFSLLSSLEEAGVKLPTSYIDFIRAISQLKPYETILAKDSKAPRITKLFESHVRESAEKIKTHVTDTMSVSETARSAIKLWRADQLSIRDAVNQIRKPKTASPAPSTPKPFPVTCSRLFSN